MDLGEIKTHLRIEVGRGASLDSQLDDYVNLGIREMSRMEDFRMLRATSTASATTTTRSVNLPASCGDIVSIWHRDTTSGGNQPTREVHPATIQDARLMFTEAATGTPRVYVRRGKINDTAAGSIDCWPIPAAAYVLDVEHLEFFTDLDNDTASNVFTTDYPRAVIYRAKEIACGAVGDKERWQMARMQLAVALKEIREAEIHDHVGPPGPLSVSTGALLDTARND